ncbi:MAG UNVERIFIED_CONTAM: hypothetical protein LVR18_43895 [Planctomycetaceae bacterium]
MEPALQAGTTAGFFAERCPLASGRCQSAGNVPRAPPAATLAARVRTVTGGLTSPARLERVWRRLRERTYQWSATRPFSRMAAACGRTDLPAHTPHHTISIASP